MWKQSLKLENPLAHMHPYTHEREKERESEKETDRQTDTHRDSASIHLHIIGH